MALPLEESLIEKDRGKEQGNSCLICLAGVGRKKGQEGGLLPSRKWERGFVAFLWGEGGEASRQIEMRPLILAPGKA